MSFDKIITNEKDKEYFIELNKFIDEQYSINTVYPKYEEIYNSFKLTPYKNVKVVILGQDPYHGENEAHGLSFSVRENIKNPPSLKNIFKELQTDLGITRDKSDLTDWAKQGVLLLNSVLTVEKDKPASHRKHGWEIFTDTVISKLNESGNPIVFVLWGNYAKEKQILITNDKHLIISSVHPSPFSARNGFFGSKPFSRINDFLKLNNIDEIKF